MFVCVWKFVKLTLHKVEFIKAHIVQAPRKPSVVYSYIPYNIVYSNNNNNINGNIVFYFVYYAKEVLSHE